MYEERIAANNIELAGILETAQNLPDAGGGGVSINAVTASLLPGTVVDGQIVILTGTAAPNIYLGYGAPDNPVAGDIWIHTVDTTAGYPFLIGTATLKPGATVQYNGSAWVYVDAYIGVNGAWQLFSTLSPLSSLAWEQIIAIANSGEDCSKFFAVGDETAVLLSTGENVPVVIGDFAHNTITGTSNKAALAFTFKNCLNTTYKMNATNTNAGGWNGSQMRTTTMPAILSTFPAALTADGAIKYVDVLASAGNQSASLVTSSDRLRLHSITELGLRDYAIAGEGTKYAYYTSGNRVKTVNGTAANYWTRSPSSAGASAYFCLVGLSGASNFSNATYSYGVACGFDI